MSADRERDLTSGELCTLICVALAVLGAVAILGSLLK